MRTVMMLEAGTLTVQREKGDPPAKRSGWGNGDGWTKEHHFMYFVKKELAREYGIHLAKVTAAKDMHLIDSEVPILRPPRGKIPKEAHHNICIYDDKYMIRSAAEDYNAWRPVDLTVIMGYFGKEDHATDTG